MTNRPLCGDSISGDWPPPAPPPPKPHPLRLSTVLLLVTLLSVVAFGVNRTVRQAASASPLSPASWAPSVTLPSLAPPAASPSLARPAASAPRRPPTDLARRAPVGHPGRAAGAWSPPSSSGISSGSLDLATLAAKVDPGLVDINTQLGNPNAQAAGTGIVLDSSGEVLTNNHVISGATGITVTDIGNGQTYPATVIGYDRSHDIALLQLQGASGLQTASIGDSSKVAVGDEIAAIGNAGGRGGTPSIAAGTVSALDQTVTVSDDSTGSSEQLLGLIQVAANVQPGDSGGPLVNAAGQVIGVDTAGSAGSRFPPSSAEGLAIPINDAIAISAQIQAGSASATIHIGPTGILGVLVQGPSAQAGPGRHGKFRIRHRPAVSGTPIAGVAPGSPAEQSGLTAGDVIVSLDGAPVDSPSTLTTLLSAHHPGDSVQLAWVDPSGQQHTATVQLAAGPPN
ncbi:MAG: trypsin-like peptidase domain-containing protein [Pseudonocardiales bacterium]|nr:trypsin-like peptidase domain-containing protein [Pseudonocardiales bacterium]